MRLQKYMAHCGVASRRHAEEIIRSGQVYVNGKPVVEMGFMVSPEDRVEWEGRVLSMEKKQIYIMLNKPWGYISSMSDPQGRPTVLDLVKGIKARVYPVGRLDFDTTGLLLLTNDGNFTFTSTHPSAETRKTYLAEIEGVPETAVMERLENGIVLDGKKTWPAEAELLETYGRKSSLIQITLHEGRNRQVKRMCEAVGHSVIQLKRVAVGGIVLGDLPEGQWRYLTEKEIKQVRSGGHE